MSCQVPRPNPLNWSTEECVICKRPFSNSTMNSTSWCGKLFTSVKPSYTLLPTCPFPCPSCFPSTSELLPLTTDSTFYIILQYTSGDVTDKLVHDRWWQMPYYYSGCKMYDLLAGSKNMESSYILGKGKALEAFPMLKAAGLCGAVVYYDGRFMCFSQSQRKQ